jgi:hypothetical protein
MAAKVFTYAKNGDFHQLRVSYFAAFWRGGAHPPNAGVPPAGRNTPSEACSTPFSRHAQFFASSLRACSQTPPHLRAAPPAAQTLLHDCQRTSPEFNANPGALLDSPADDEGTTPLIAAASRGHFQVVELLLEHGAGLHAQNARADGGSALHEAVSRRQDAMVDLLLRRGANAFVENAKGFTAMDLACSARNPDLLRRLEAGAAWSGWLSQKVPRLGGLGSEWQRRWVVVTHRFPAPTAPPERRLVHVVLCCFKAANATAPSCRAWLDGARAEPAAGAAPGQVELRLHRRHAVPSGAHATGSPQTGFALHFRPDGAAVDACAVFASIVNNRGYAAGVAPPQQPHRRAGPSSSPSSGQGGGAAAPAAPAQAAYSPLAAGAGAGRASSSVAADAALARRLQEENDAAYARMLQNSPSLGRAGSGAPAAPPISQPSQNMSALYPGGNCAASTTAQPSAPEQSLASGGAAPGRSAAGGGGGGGGGLECAVCIEPMGQGSGRAQAVPGACGHAFCYDCLVEVRVASTRSHAISTHPLALPSDAFPLPPVPFTPADLRHPATQVSQVPQTLHAGQHHQDILLMGGVGWPPPSMSARCCGPRAGGRPAQVSPLLRVSQPSGQM